MTNTIHCQKLNKVAEALEFAPMPGALGQRILASISKQAWQMWLAHQTMLINEYRLNLLDAQAKSFLKSEMEKFVFGDGSQTPPGFKH